MNLKKKNHRPVAALFGIVLFAGGCVPELEELPLSGGAVLLFRVLNEGGMSVPLDPENDPIYSRVEVSGSGPGEGNFVMASIGPECTLTDLREGEWQIEVRAFNSQEAAVAFFSGSLEISGEEVRREILLDSMGKKSQLLVELRWDADLFEEVMAGASIFKEDPFGQTYPEDLELGESSPGVTSGEIEVEPGTAVIGLDFEYTGAPAAERVFPFFIGPGIEMTATIDIMQDEDEEGVQITCDFDPRQLTPGELQVAGRGPPFFAGRPELFSVSDKPEDETEWFLGGEKVGTGPSRGILVPQAGHSIVTVILSEHSPPSIRSGFAEITFSESYRIGPLVFFQQDTAPAGIRGLSVSPSGELVAGAGYSGDSMVLWRRDSNSGALEKLLETGPDTADVLDGISDTVFSPDGTLLAGAAKSSSSLLLWEIGDTEGPPELVLNMKSVMNAEAPDLEYLDGVTGLAFSEDEKFLYAASAGADSLAVFAVEDTGLRELQVLDGADIGTDGFDQPEEISLSKEEGQGWAAVPCLRGDSLFIFRRDPVSGLLSLETVFTDEEGVTTELNGVHRAAFFGEHLYSSSYYDDSVCHFEWVPDIDDPPKPVEGVWEYRGAVATFEVDPGGTSGVCPELPVGALDYSQEIALHPDGGFLALAAGGNDGVCLFERNPTDGSLTPLAAAIDGTTGLPGLYGPADPGGYSGGPTDPLEGFDGARSLAWSPDGKNLYCGASNSNRITVFQEW